MHKKMKIFLALIYGLFLLGFIYSAFAISTNQPISCKQFLSGQDFTGSYYDNQPYSLQASVDLFNEGKLSENYNLRGTLSVGNDNTPLNESSSFCKETSKGQITFIQLQNTNGCVFWAPSSSSIIYTHGVWVMSGEFYCPTICSSGCGASLSRL